MYRGCTVPTFFIDRDKENEEESDDELEDFLKDG